jgi:DNA-binding transcriptional regulator of glucitol operon
MNRIQFFVLTGLSSLIVLLLIGHIFLTRASNFEVNQLSQAQQVINQGQAFQGNLQRLAGTIYQDSVKTGDQGLKDILARNEISVSNPPVSTNSPDSNGTQAPSPSPSTQPH